MERVDPYLAKCLKSKVEYTDQEQKRKEKEAVRTSQSTVTAAREGKLDKWKQKPKTVKISMMQQQTEMCIYSLGGCTIKRRSLTL